MAQVAESDLEGFLRSFQSDSGKYKYHDLISNMHITGTVSLVIDYNDFKNFGESYAEGLLDDPDTYLESFDKALRSLLKSINPEYGNAIEKEAKIRIGGYTVVTGIRSINTKILNKLINVSGMVVRTSEVKSLGIRTIYSCKTCGYKIENVAKEPTHCTECDAEREFNVDRDSIMTDHQTVRIQELHEDLPAGQIPDHVDVTVLGDLVNQCRPGDRVLLTGVVRIDQDKRHFIKKNLFDKQMEANNITYLGGRIGGISGSLEISPEDEKNILKLASQPDIYNKLIASFAPHVYGYESIKEAIMLLVVGSVPKQLPDGSMRRADINVLLIGDPGIAKSEMLKHTAKIAPRGSYVSGRGASAAGLTAAVVKDKNTEAMTLEAGALVLADQGILGIDEFDKLKPDDRTALHEAMEQQTCSVNKAGINATLNARTSILAAANPLYSVYKKENTTKENVNLPESLLSRFDLIFTLQDIPEEKRDTEIANHILNIHKNPTEAIQPPIDNVLLSKYLAYVKGLEPKIDDDITAVLRRFYLKMRALKTENSLPITIRQLEALIRLATARAKLLIKDKIEMDDALRVIYITQQMFDKDNNMKNPKTTQDKPVEEMSQIKAFDTTFNRLYQYGDVMHNEFVDELVETKKFTQYEAGDFIERAINSGRILENKKGYYSKSR